MKKMDEKIREFIPENSAGFTLVELIITLTVLSILSSIAYPSLTESIANNRVRSHAEEIQSILAFARSEAITRGTDVIISPDNGWAGNNGRVTANGATILQLPPLSGTAINSTAAQFSFDARGLFTGANVVINDAKASHTATLSIDGGGATSLLITGKVQEQLETDTGNAQETSDEQK
ncbi:GspH/FimT family pseudopilin [Endozoicomonas sp. GU-1]|uniref:GspH/FimT family pseudopilin n=2 Tax=Endozoicomonas sp. GU-1 TaxID=3009078 RepID=UPI0022B52373|nr:GspH/FimT family pseudopilin [Endozoicomonas sp. GU-1]WBA87067.1 GspH/FimT family pseudopilin [Endozoicomonas sp. GU-1]